VSGHGCGRGNGDGSGEVEGQGPPRTPDLGAVLGGLVLVALAVAVAAHEVLDRTWDWRWYAAGVLVLAGLAVVATAVAGALGGRRAGPRPPR
jgi:hypothetical protein